MLIEMSFAVVEKWLNSLSQFIMALPAWVLQKFIIEHWDWLNIELQGCDDTDPSKFPSVTLIDLTRANTKHRWRQSWKQGLLQHQSIIQNKNYYNDKKRTRLSIGRNPFRKQPVIQISHFYFVIVCNNESDNLIPVAHSGHVTPPDHVSRCVHNYKDPSQPQLQARHSNFGS